MSILIKDVKMPKKCGECPIVKFDGHGYICRLLGDSHKASVGFPIRMSGCPLVELPEKHGRLIDANALMADICNSINEMTKISIAVDGDYLWCKLNDALKNAPTIVEAEGE